MRAFAARLVCALAYPLLAHWASHDGSGAAAAIALGDLVLVVLIEPLLRGRIAAWVWFAAIAAGLFALSRTLYAQLLLLAPPVLFIGLVAWFFGRTLRPPRVALITRIVAAMDRCTPTELSPALQRYTRNLTGSWCALLVALAAINALLAIVAVPDGVLARLGYVPAGTMPVWGVPRAYWSWVANLLNYGVIGGFFFGEYLLRRRHFPDRLYGNFPQFVRQMVQLGPDFWRGLFR